MTFDSRKLGSTKYYLLGVGKSSICLGLWKGPGGEADVQGSKKWQDTHWRYIFCQVFPYFKGQSGTPHWIWDPPSITTKYSTAVDLFFCYYYRCWRARAVCLWTHYWKTMLLLGQWHYCHKEKIYCFAIATIYTKALSQLLLIQYCCNNIFPYDFLAYHSVLKWPRKRQYFSNRPVKRPCIGLITPVAYRPWMSLLGMPDRFQ